MPDWYLYEKQKKMLNEMKEHIPISKNTLVRIAIERYYRYLKGRDFEL